MNDRWLLSRRALLGGIGALGVSSVLAPKTAQAAVPPRLVVIHVPEGMWSGAQRPVSGASTLGPIFDPMDAFRAQTLVLNNLDMKSRSHGPGGDEHHRAVPHMLTGTEMADENNAGGPSLDQRIAQAIGGSSQFASLQFAVRIIYGDTNSKPLWSAAKRVVPAMQSPYDAYKRIFANAVPTDPVRPTFNLKKSALDHSLAEINSLRTRLAASDRERLDSYHESLRIIEKRLINVTPPTPGSCTPPVLGNPIDIKAESNYPKIGQLQMDLLLAALQCGLTRVASLQWGNSNDQCGYSFLGVNALGHDLAHNNANVDGNHEKKKKVYRWYSQQFAYLLGKLTEIKEDGGVPMIENTVVLWASEFSDSNGHASNRLLWFLFGNANGALKQGRVIDCAGRGVNDLLTALANTFGVTGTFGNPAYGSGPLTQIYG